MAKTQKISFEQIDSILKNSKAKADIMPFLTEGFMIDFNHTVLTDILGKETPYIIEDTRIIMIHSGEAEIELNLQRYQIQGGTIILCNPGVIVKLHHMTDDYVVKGMMISKILMSTIFDEQMPRCVSAATDYAVLRPTQQDHQTLASILDVLWNISRHYDFHKRITYPLIKSAVEMVDLIYNKVTEQEQATMTRGYRLYNQFMHLVAQHGAVQHSIDFYASEMCVSNNYLSFLVKQASGLTAKEWIDKAIIAQAKMLLKTTDLQNAQISHRLNFTNPSFFNKFFKRVTGMTPVEYRTS